MPVRVARCTFSHPPAATVGSVFPADAQTPGQPHRPGRQHRPVIAPIWRRRDDPRCRQTRTISPLNCFVRFGGRNLGVQLLSGVIASPALTPLDQSSSVRLLAVTPHRGKDGVRYTTADQCSVCFHPLVHRDDHPFTATMQPIDDPRASCCGPHGGGCAGNSRTRPGHSTRPASRNRSYSPSALLLLQGLLFLAAFFGRFSGSRSCTAGRLGPRRSAPAALHVGSAGGRPRRPPPGASSTRPAASGLAGDQLFQGTGVGESLAWLSIVGRAARAGVRHGLLRPDVAYHHSKPTAAAAKPPGPLRGAPGVLGGLAQGHS